VNVPAQAVDVVRRLRERNFPAWWVGGAVRDRLLGREPEEYDVATAAAPADIIRIFRSELGCTTLEVGRAFGVVRVQYEGRWFEIATLRSDQGYSDRRHPDRVEYGADPRLDAARRDFTVNALFEDPLTGEILDFTGGRADIEARVLRAVGDPLERFAEDHLRKLRAVRFAAQLGFAVDGATWDAIVADTALDVSPERIQEELLKMLTGPAPRQALKLLRESGLLRVFLPEVDDMAGVAQPPQFHPEGDVFTHTLLMFELAEKPMPPLLALAVLLHDVGKPPCADASFQDGRICFPSHEAVGAGIAENVLRRLRFSNDVVDAVSALVREHMRIKDAPNMRKARLVRLVADPLFPIHLELHRLDCSASHGKLEVHDFLAQRYREHLEAPVLPEPLIDGHDLIDMGLSPGPIFGKILGEVREMQLDGSINSRDEALAAAHRLMNA